MTRPARRPPAARSIPPRSVAARSVAARSVAVRSVAVLTVAALAMVACDRADGADDRRLHMGIAVANVSLNFAVEMANGAKQAASDAGDIDFQVVGPPSTDGPAEVQMFQNLTTTARDGVILENLNPPLFTRPAAEAVARGTPVVALDTAPTDGSNVTFYIGNDNYQLGAIMAQELLKRLPPNPAGTVVVGVPNPGTPVLDNRALGIKETLNRSAPGIQVLGPYQTSSEPTQSYNAWSAQVNAHPDALAFLGVGDADSYNLARLRQERRGPWLTAGFDVDAKTLEAVRAGVNFVTIDPEHYLKGYLSAAILVDSVRDHGGKLPKGWFVSPGGVIDTGNVSDIITRQSSPQAAYAWYRATIERLLADVPGQLKPLDQAR